MIKAYKLYTGEDGNSHVMTGTVQPGIITEAISVSFKETAPNTFYDWHNAPDEQYVITISGVLEFETKPGEKFIVRPGDILLACDVTGTAHKWRILGDEPWKRAYVIFDRTKPVNFIPDEGQVMI